MKIVEVTWVDSNIFRGWSTFEKTSKYLVRQSLQCKTVGYLYSDTEEEVSLIMSLAWEYKDDEEAKSNAEMLTIPRVAIVSIQELE